MCHTLLHDPKLYSLLAEVDEERAARVRAAGCFCGDVLHSARYRRKPRGIPPELRGVAYRRHSFCCNLDGCRSRHTPQSVYYLGRRAYLGAVMLLATALRCEVSGRALRQRFAYSFLQIRSHSRHPCRSANPTPCRASRGLPPPSECALVGPTNHNARSVLLRAL